MKKIVLFLFCFALVPLSYAQMIRMTSVIPTKPVGVVEHLYVSGEESSVIRNLYNNNNEVSITDNNTYPKYFFVGRDMFIYPSVNTVTSGNVYGGGEIYGYGNNSQTINADVFEMPTRVWKVLTSSPITAIDLNGTGVIGGNKISANLLTINQIKFDPLASNNLAVQQREWGTRVSGANIPYMNIGELQTEEAFRAKKHIYGAWVLSQTYPSEDELCNPDKTPCSEERCEACVEQAKETCKDIADFNITIPAEYKKNLTSYYRKIYTVRFYTGFKDGYDTDNSKCIVKADKIDSQGLSSVVEESEFSNLRLGNSNYSQDIGKNKSIEEKCANCTGGLPCHYYISFNHKTGQQFKIDDFVSNVTNLDPTNNPTLTAFKSNAVTEFGANTGLKCKETEQVFDIYELFCSGNVNLHNKYDNYYKTRHVICYKDDQSAYHLVYGEYNDLTSGQKEILRKGQFFSAEFAR